MEGGRVSLGLGILLLFIWIIDVISMAEVLSGRFKGELSLSPLECQGAQPCEKAPLLFGASSQLDLGLDLEGLSLDKTLLFTNVGPVLAWLRGDASFPPAGAAAAQRRTIAQNDYVKVMRSYPSLVRAGQAFEVMIIIEALQTIPPDATIEVIEELPEGWSLEPIDPLGIRLSHKSWKWVVSLSTPGTRETIRYRAEVPPLEEEGLFTITGTVRSNLFPDLDFSDTIEVIRRPLPVPAAVRLRQDVIFSARIRRGQLVEPIGFRSLYLGTQITFERGLKLANFFTLRNIGTIQTPSFSWRDTISLQGKTTEGISIKLSLRFSGEEGNPGQFDRGSLRIGALPLAEGLTLQSAADFDGEGLSRLRLDATLSTDILWESVRLSAAVDLSETLRPELTLVNVRLSSPIDGLFRIEDRYGLLSYDEEDGDGVEDGHFDLVRRRITLQFAMDKLDIRSISTFEPILEDIDADGADEKAAEAKLLRQDLRVRYPLKEVLFTGYLTLLAGEAADFPLNPARIRSDLTITHGIMRLTASTILTFDPPNVEGVLSFTMSF